MGVAVPMIISAGLCWLLFRDIDFASMWHTVTTECRPGWIVLGLVISIMSHVFRALRWRLQLKALGIDTPLFIVVLSIFGTYAVNLVFPRLGEVWRTGYIAARRRAPFTAVFGSMVADRIADTFTVLLLLLAAFVLASGTIIDYLGRNTTLLPTLQSLATSPWLWCGVALAIAAVVIVMRSRAGIAGRIRKAVVELWQGFAVVFTMHGRALWLLWTVGIWGCYFMQLYVAFFAFEFTEQVVHDYGATAVLVTFVLSSIAMGVPSNGGIGPWQWSVIFALGFYGVDTLRAGAFANLVLGCNTLLIIALGLFTFACIAIDRRSPASHKSTNTNPTIDKTECQK